MINKEILIVESSTNQQIIALKAFLKALKINFVISKEPYNKEFVKNILESKNQIKTSKITKIEKENLKLFLGL